MKKLITFGKSGILALAVLFAVSCSDDDDKGGGGGNLPDGTYIKAKVDGDSWETFEIQGQSVAVATSSGSGASRVIMINGSGDMNGSTAMAVNLIGIDAEGTYPLTSDSDSVVAYLQNQTSYDNSGCENTTGTLKITSISATKVEGTFSLTGKNDEDCSQSRAITQGSFRGVFVN
ncbi:MAG TPA: DUF6252 family protein [Flavobacterium sp.]|jgi:hypothetical protein